MPQNHGQSSNYRRNYRSKDKNNRKGNSNVDGDNPVVIAFREYSEELDDKHDRHERIVKLSRDITIESKRIIFLLHTIDAKKDNKSTILKEAEERLEKLIKINFKAVAKELSGQDPYQYRSAFSPGLQEFIEAYSFMEYFKHNENENQSGLSDWKALQQKMKYDGRDEGMKENGEEHAPETELENIETFEFAVDPTEYILGVSDLTGELMRRCINSLGSGETTVSLDTCRVLQILYTGYISLNVQRCRELSRKIYTMRQSVLKAESVCYNVKVRGGEAAKWGSVFDNKASDDMDEGFY